jgi:hypothetical protein
MYFNATEHNMYMDSDELDEKLGRCGELMVVLESGVEYDLHSHTTEIDTGKDIIKTEGMKDGEYVVVEIPAESVEHTYFHREA